MDQGPGNPRGQSGEPRGRGDPGPRVEREGPRCKGDSDLRQKGEL